MMKHTILILICFIVSVICSAKLKVDGLGSLKSIPIVKPNSSSPLDTCGGNCPSNDCGTCPCGYSTNYIDIVSICSQFNNWNQACCQCIVQNESGGDANAVNADSDGSFDVGVFQINSVNWACNGGSAPCDPTANLNCAINVYCNAGSWSPWTTCSGCGCC